MPFAINHPSSHEMDFIRPERPPVMRSHNVDKLIYQMFAILGIVQWVAAAVVMAAAPLPIPIIPVPAEIVDIWSNMQLIGACCLGAFLGTAARLSFPAPELKAVRGYDLIQVLSHKAIVSMSCGLFISPWLLRYMEWNPDKTNIVFASGCVAFMAEVTLSIVTRVYQKYAEKKANELTGTTP